MSQEKKKKYRGLRNFDLIVTVTAFIGCFIALSFIGINFDIVNFFAGITTFLASIGLYGWLLYFGLTSEKMKGSGWLTLTILLLLSCPVVILSAIFFMNVVYLGFLSAICITLGLVSPFVALVTGIQGTVNAIKQKRFFLAFVTLLIALLPYILVGTIILLAQNGIVVIRFM